MNILFDLVHAADVNLFKNSIFYLKKNGHKIFISLRQRGALLRIAQKELQGFEIQITGNHQKGVLKKIIAQIIREIRFYKILKRNKINVAVCQGLTFGIAGLLRKVPIIHHDDDPEYVLSFLLGKYLATKDIMPDFMNVSGNNFVKYKGFKEIAYLHPTYFTPDISVLNNENLAAYEYIFIREISNASVNYHGQVSNLYEILKHIHSKGIKVLLSLENKELINLYKDYALIIQEPVSDLYSLIYYSKLAISSGDTMARESCLMGVPNIYTGGRNMVANNILIKKGFMFKLELLSDIYAKMDELLLNGDELLQRNNMRNFVNENYDDLNNKFIDQILNIKIRKWK